MENVIPGNVWRCTWRMLFQVMCGVHMENVIPGNVWCYSLVVWVLPIDCVAEFYVNFDKESLENTTYSFEYDYSSIMHYGEFYFR
jgi:Astacin (Peptidase family M12A).